MSQKVESADSKTLQTASETITGLAASFGLGVAENERQASEIPVEFVGRALSLKPEAAGISQRGPSGIALFYALRNSPLSLSTNFALTAVHRC